MRHFSFVFAFIALLFHPTISTAQTSAATSLSQVTELKALFQNGQTFLTWHEIAGGDVRYNVYRSKAPLQSAEDLSPDKRLTQVYDYSSLNLMASINRMDLSKVGQGKKYAIPKRVYFVIEEGKAPLSDDTGLFVATAHANETVYYAVTAVTNGTENKDLSSANALAEGVAEKVEPVQAYRQNDEVDYVHWVDDQGTPSYPAMGATPGGAYNFRVHAPKGNGPYALIGVLHGALFQYNTPDKERYGKLDGLEGDTSVRVSLDSPLIRGEIEGITLPSLGRDSFRRSTSQVAASASASSRPAGSQPTFLRSRSGGFGGWGSADARVLWTMDWVAANYPVDKDRYSLRGESMGGMGSIQIALSHPDRFAAFNGYVPAFRRASDSGFGIGSDAYSLVEQHSDGNLPFIMFTAGRADNTVKWADKVEFAKFADAQKVGYAFYWDRRQHVYIPGDEWAPTWDEPNGMPTMDLTKFSLRKSFPAISQLSINSDFGKVDFAVKPAERPKADVEGAGDLIGSWNGWAGWDFDTIKDEKDSYEITLFLQPFAKQNSATATITPRRLQAFSAQPNDQVNFVVKDKAGKVLKQGIAPADKYGAVSVPEVPLTKEGVVLALSTMK